MTYTRRKLRRMGRFMEKNGTTARQRAAGRLANRTPEAILARSDTLHNWLIIYRHFTRRAEHQKPLNRTKKGLKNVRRSME